LAFGIHITVAVEALFDLFVALFVVGDLLELVHAQRLPLRLLCQLLKLVRLDVLLRPYVRQVVFSVDNRVLIFSQNVLIPFIFDDTDFISFPKTNVIAELGSISYLAGEELIILKPRRLFYPRHPEFISICLQRVLIWRLVVVGSFLLQEQFFPVP